MITIFDAIRSPELFAPWFKDEKTWTAWFAFLAALFGLPMTDEQRAIYQRCTGRADEPGQAHTEAWLVVGRRGGKSFVLALIAVFLGVARDYRPHLQSGERATIKVIATAKVQAGIILRYVKALLLEIPALAELVERETEEQVDLTNRVTIEVATASFRRVRGYTLAAAICDEIAFWPTEDMAEPDTEILNALRPSMATIPGALLICASSPYAKRGELWNAYRRWYGHEGKALVWNAPTQVMNPTVPQETIDEEYERDPANAAAEYGAQFRGDIADFVARAALEACVDVGTAERPPLRQHRYTAFADPSGGSVDSMTLAIAHKEGETSILDVLREVKPPFVPEAVVDEFAALLKRYRIWAVRGDRYAGEWVASSFRRAGINYEPSEKSKSDLYREVLPMINSGAVGLLDNPRLSTQLLALERRVARGGKDSIDHPRGGHDDLANAAAGVLVLASRRPGAASSEPYHQTAEPIADPLGDWR